MVILPHLEKVKVKLCQEELAVAYFQSDCFSTVLESYQ